MKTDNANADCAFYCAFHFVPVADLADLPIFCAPVLTIDDPTLACGIDGWNVDRSGDHITDWNRGQDYADLAVAYARTKRDPAWIGFILASIAFKVRFGLMTAGSLEGGFFTRIGKLAYLGSMD